MFPHRIRARGCVACCVLRAVGCVRDFARVTCACSRRTCMLFGCALRVTTSIYCNVCKWTIRILSNCIQEIQSTNVRMSIWQVVFDCPCFQVACGQVWHVFTLFLFLLPSFGASACAFLRFPPFSSPLKQTLIFPQALPIEQLAMTDSSLKPQREKRRGKRSKEPGEQT